MPFRAVSTFWIAHPNNNLINNAAAGSQVNNTEVHQCFFAFLFVSVLVYMYMQHSMWSSNSSTLLSGTACFSLLSEQAVVEMVLLFLLHHLCQLVFMSVQRQMLNGRKEGLVCRVWRRKWQPTPVLLPGKSHGRRSLVGCSPWGR